MAYRLVYPESYLRRARKFLKRHPELRNQYRKILQLLELDPAHPSLRLHRLSGRFDELYSVSINIRYRVTLEFLVSGDEILLINVGSHDQAYRKP